MSARALVGIFGLALVLRVTALWELSGSPLSEVLLGDSRGYVDWAREIAAGNWRGDEVFYQAPLYPYFLALLFRFVSPTLEGIRIAQALLGSVACVLIALATSRFFSQRAGRVAGLLLACYPLAIFFDAIIQKTSVALFLIALLLFLLSRFDEVEKIRWPLGAGIVLAALILTRENALVLFPVIGLWCVVPWSRGRGDERATRLGLFVVGAALLLVPVGSRNLALGDAFLITTSQLGPNLYIGNNSEADGRYRSLLPDRGDARLERHDAKRLAERVVGRRLTPQEVSDYWVDRVFDYVAGDPLDWFRLLVHKIYMVLNADEIADTESVEAYADESVLLAVLYRVFHFGVLFPIAVLGMWATRTRWRELLVLHGMGLAMVAGVAVFFVMARYRFPLVALLTMFAGAGIAALFDRDPDLPRPSLREGLVAFGVAALVCNLPLGVAQEPRALTHYNVAMAMLQQGRLEGAQRFLERAAATSREPVVHLNLGAVLERRGRLDQARAAYEVMLSESLANPLELHRRLVGIYRRLGDEDAAARHSMLAEPDAGGSDSRTFRDAP